MAFTLTEVQSVSRRLPWALPAVWAAALVSK